MQQNAIQPPTIRETIVRKLYFYCDRNKIKCNAVQSVMELVYKWNATTSFRHSFHAHNLLQLLNCASIKLLRNACSSAKYNKIVWVFWCTFNLVVPFRQAASTTFINEERRALRKQNSINMLVFVLAGLGFLVNLSGKWYRCNSSALVDTWFI